MSTPEAVALIANRTKCRCALHATHPLLTGFTCKVSAVCGEFCMVSS